MAAAFPEIEEAAAGCRFRDCSHTSEPGCAVRAAVEAGTIPKRRLESYLILQQEMADTAARQEIRARLDRKAADKGGKAGGSIKYHYNRGRKR